MFESFFEFFKKIKCKNEKCGNPNSLKIVELTRFEIPKNTPLSDQSQATLGILKVDNDEICYTLEPPWRNNGKDSCIPTNEYICTRYSSLKHPNSWLVNDVPNRSYILFHTGNTELDSLGCILLGLKTGYIDKRRAVLESQKAYKKFQNLMKGIKKFKLIIKEK